MWYRLDQIAAYCDEAAKHGVTELALTEHSNRFVEVMSIVGPFWERTGHEPTSRELADYFAFTTRNSLDDYVALAQLAKDEGLPVKIGLEVDYVRDQMDEQSVRIAAVYAGESYLGLVSQEDIAEAFAILQHLDASGQARKGEAVT